MVYFNPSDKETADPFENQDIKVNKMNINYKEFESWDGFQFEELEFLKKTGFVELKSFNCDTRDEDRNVCIGKIGNEVWYYREVYGRIWHDDFGRIE